MTEVWSPGDLGLVDSADTPALNALIHAYVERVNVLFPAISRAAESPTPETKDALLKLAHGPMMEEFTELAGWLYPARRAPTIQETVRYTLQLERDGVERESIQPIISGLHEIPAGSDFDTLIWPPNDHLNWPPKDKTR